MPHLNAAPFLLALAAGALVGAGQAPDERALLSRDIEQVVTPFLEDFCVTCHGGDEPAGGLGLERSIDVESVQQAESEWRYLAQRVRLGQMPPSGEYAPTDDERADLVDWVERALALRYDPSMAPDPGAPVIRRLTRGQARATLRDLFAIEIGALGLLPEDDVALDFEGIGSAQHLPAASVDGLLEFARVAAREAVLYDSNGWPARVRHPAAELDPERQGRMASTREVGGPHEFPRPGQYVLRFAAWADQAGDEIARAGLVVDGETLASFEVHPERGDEPEVLELALTVQSAGTRQVAVRFENDYYQPDDPDPGQRDRNLALVWLEVEGPFEPPRLSPLLTSLLERHGVSLENEPPPGARRELLAELARAVWRRPPAEDDVERLAALSEELSPFGAGLRLTLEAMLASPRFWYRIEADGTGAGPVRALDGFELATRLSFWLWGSTPDQTLLDLAQSGALTEPDVLAQQVRRLLFDPRSRHLSEEFVPQWLALRRLQEREFDDRELVPSMVRETELLFEAVLREALPLRALLDAQFTFVDEDLARHYGITGVEGPHMRRVSTSGTGRRGLLGHASILAATSEPARTSPVLRGKWILDALLGDPPPAPPPGVPALAANQVASATSLRAQLELHRADPACAVCHDTMDPLGLALEGFGPRGRERSFDGAHPIDDRATLPGGSELHGAAGLVEFLCDDPRFLRTFVEKQLVFALGRALGPADRGEVARIVAGLDPRQATIVDVIQALAASHPFRFRRTIDPRPDPESPSRRPL
ncbi:DUF1592 domain-containing protein [Engelhardtia mirabilis]|uniref:Cytochrome c domain-containing protein n=1 Tax=Engelhardtia mirabilis TaxID=2528011 RepID=A0A518BKS8_9BACT|nr:hypothetical protein Pla133_26690 [Planctomycetes bacterium Pla133]QDV01907.1 hypothetical protein Pla86_26680 [Planctomycetes bacterium Pla86]